MSYFIVIFAISDSGLKIVPFGHHFLLSFHWTAASSSTMTLPSLRRPPVGLYTVSAGELFTPCLHGGWLLQSWKTFLTSCWYFCLDIALALLCNISRTEESTLPPTQLTPAGDSYPWGNQQVTSQIQGLSVTIDCFLSDFSSHKLSSLQQTFVFSPSLTVFSPFLTVRTLVTLASWCLCSLLPLQTSNTASEAWPQSGITSPSRPLVPPCSLSAEYSFPKQVSNPHKPWPTPPFPWHTSVDPLWVIHDPIKLAVLWTALCFSDSGHFSLPGIPVPS